MLSPFMLSYSYSLPIPTRHMYKYASGCTIYPLVTLSLSIYFSYSITPSSFIYLILMFLTSFYFRLSWFFKGYTHFISFVFPFALTTGYPDTPRSERSTPLSLSYRAQSCTYGGNYMYFTLPSYLLNSLLIFGCTNPSLLTCSLLLIVLAASPLTPSSAAAGTSHHHTQHGTPSRPQIHSPLHTFLHPVYSYGFPHLQPTGHAPIFNFF